MSVQKLKGQLYKAEGPGNWTHILIPINVAEIFKKNGFIPVKGKIDAYAFKGMKLTPTGRGNHRLSINEKIRRTLGKQSGDWVDLELELDPEKKQVIVPDDFLIALQGNQKAFDFFETLTDSYKRYYTEWILFSKKEETRVSRIQKAVERLSKKLKFHD